MHFEPLKLEDMDRVRPYLTMIDSQTCDYTPGCVFIWRDFYQMKGCFTELGFFSKLHNEVGEKYYNLPLSPDPEKALLALYDYASKPLRFCTVPENWLPTLQKVFPACKIEEQRDYYDYLYLASDLIGLHGKKFSGQRNQISQFKRNVENWRYEVLNDQNLEDVKAFFLHSDFVTDPKNESAQEESRKVLEVLDHPEIYRMLGGVLYADEKVVGFSLGEIVGNTLFIHIEKADRKVKGAYQMVVNQAAIHFATPEVEYINREDDMGDPGLRTAKLAYHPIDMLKKYIVIIP